MAVPSFRATVSSLLGLGPERTYLAVIPFAVRAPGGAAEPADSILAAGLGIR